MKFFNVYGRGEEHKGRAASMVYHLAQQLSKDKVCTLYASNDPAISNGDQYRDFISVQAVVYHIIFLLKKARESQAFKGLYNIGTGNPLTFNMLASYVADALGIREYEIEYVNMPLSLASQYQNGTVANIDKLKKLEGDAWYNNEHIMGVKDYIIYLKNKGLC